jgi:peroxiredoxin
MEVLYPRCCGLDVHKATITACVLVREGKVKVAQALHDTPASTCDPYIELASLVRFEHLAVRQSDSALDTAGSLLALEEELHQEAGFKLTGLDGKTYSLLALRGHVVLLNFWATWCPPCRKEMPDMESLYRRLQAKGLIVLAVSDEDRETVASFEEKQKYTFPILLDPDRKVNTSFNVEGIPKSFLFDRDGKLVSQAIDMRTEAQFLEMLKVAGM